MSSKTNRKGSRKSKNDKNIKPSYVKKYNNERRKSSSSSNDGKLHQIERVQFQRNNQFVISDYQFKQNKFYNNSNALKNTSIQLYKNVENFNWYQYVQQYSNSSEECLNITIKQDSNYNHDSKRIDLNSFKNASNLKMEEEELKSLLKTANTTYNLTMFKLFEPYIHGIQSILDIILSFKGLHIFPIRYSVEMLPFLHPTVRNYKRKSIWDKASKNRTKSGALSHAVINFVPNLNCNIIEDIYDEFIEHIRNDFKLDDNYSEEAIFYIYSGYNMLMGVQSKNHNRNRYHINQIQAKNIFTRLYIESLNNFKIDNKQNAFWLDLIGINYYYYQRKRSYSPISWGSRSRCWSQNGMVLMADNTRKPVKDLCIGDKVKVLQSLPNGIKNDCDSAIIKVKIESIVDREYEMVGVSNNDNDNGKMWISPYHAVIDNNNKWRMPCDINKIEMKYESSIYNFILDKGHTLNVDGIWACTLGHDLKGNVIENPIWGSSYVIYDYFKDKKGFPNVVEYI